MRGPASRTRAPLTTDGALYCWGDDAYGQLGDGQVENPQIEPDPGRVGTAKRWRHVAAGQLDTCATKGTGKLLCFGSDAHGQLGDGTTGDPAANPNPRPVAHP